MLRIKMKKPENGKEKKMRGLIRKAYDRKRKGAFNMQMKCVSLLSGDDVALNIEHIDNH